MHKKITCCHSHKGDIAWIRSYAIKKALKKRTLEGWCQAWEGYDIKFVARICDVIYECYKPDYKNPYFFPLDHCSHVLAEPDPLDLRPVGVMIALDRMTGKYYEEVNLYSLSMRELVCFYISQG